MKILLPLIVLSMASNISSPAHIAIFTTCFRSHLRPMISIAKELSTRPNTLVTVIVSKECEDYVSSLNLNIQIEPVSTGSDTWTESIEAHNLATFITMVEKSVLSSYIIKWKENSEKIPHIIISDFMMAAAVDLGEIFSVPNVVIFSNIETYNILGEDNMQNEYTSLVSPFFTFHPSENIFARVFKHAIKRIMGFLFNRFLTAKRNELRAEFQLGPVRSLLGNGLDQPFFAFFEEFYGFAEARLTPPYIEAIGPLRLTEIETPNTAEVDDWLKNCGEFIYVAMGSIEEITEQQAQVFQKIFQSFPYSFLVSSKSFSTTLHNVKVLDWVNQREVLQNSKILAFISHGGLISVMEAIENLVPVVCLPQGKDHFYNCDRVEGTGIGESINPNELNFERLAGAIKIVIEDSKYRVALEKLKVILEGQPGEKRIADAVIAFSRVGYQHLIPRWYSLPWYQKNELDIFAVYLVIGLITYKAIKYLWQTCRRKQKID